MSANEGKRDVPVGSSASHWGTKDPAAQPSRDVVIGLPRLVLEIRTRIGPDATPEQVVDELRGRGLDATIDEVRSLWDEGHLKG